MLRSRAVAHATLVMTAATGCALVEPPTVGMEPGDVLVWELEYENHSEAWFSLYVLTANQNSSGASGMLLNACVASPLGPMRMVAPFSVHIEPAGPTGVGDLSRPRIEALPVVIDSDELPTPVSPDGYRVVIGADGDVEAILPVGDEPGQYREIC